MKVYSIVNSKNSPKLFEQCPYCKKQVNFLPIKELNDIYIDNSEYPPNDLSHARYIGSRECSNPECGEIFSIQFDYEILQMGYDEEMEEYITEKTTYNIKTLPLKDNCVYLEHIPENIEKSFVEAQRCFHNEYYIASAIMIRKTLEEFLIDFKIDGRDLSTKINNLFKNYTLKVKFDQSDFETIRELGNDGAHTVLTNFNNVGKNEVRTALEVIKNMLIMTYESNQNYENNMIKLKSLKKQ